MIAATPSTGRPTAWRGAPRAQVYARLAGGLFIVSLVAGGIGEFLVPSQLVVPGDAAATAARMVAGASLLRLGFAAYLLEAACDVCLTLVLYRLLSLVQRDLALLAVFFRLVSTSVYAASQLFYLAVLPILGGSAYLAAFTPDQRDALALLSVAVASLGSGVFFLFYGLGLAIVGYLVYASRFLPRLLGVLLALGGAGFVARSSLLLVAPAYASSLLLVPTAVAGLALTLWLLTRGVDVQEWEARMVAGDSGQ